MAANNSPATTHLPKAPSEIRNNQKYGTVLQVAKEGRGQYSAAGFTAGFEWMENAVLPDGVVHAGWTYRAVFLEGQERIGEWAYCTVMVSASPLVSAKAPASPAAEPVTA